MIILVGCCRLPVRRLQRALTGNRSDGCFSEGFQITLLPQTMAKAVFQHHTATEKLKADITPMGPIGARFPPCGDRGAQTQLSGHRVGGKTNSKVADINHFLYFTQALGKSSCSPGSPIRPAFLCVPEFISQDANQLTSFGCGYSFPFMRLPVLH